MGLNADAVGASGDPATRSWDSKDALLYALGVGAGMLDPVNQELSFTTENSHELEQQVLPTMAVVLGAGSAIAQAGDIDWGQLLHGSQGITLHREIPAEGTVTCANSITGMWDKGEGKHAIIDTEIHAVLDATDEALFTSRSSVVIRGAGGFGGERGTSATAAASPQTEPDHQVTYSTRQDQALLYRLSGDRNPLHSDPWFAGELAGFPKPILHGLCTYGFTGRALLHTLCDSDPSRFLSMDGRFSSPVFPGEDLTVQMWVDGSDAKFCTLGSDGRVVFDQGQFKFR
ncbi:MAG: MaoC/PaaZ C-terminal domain-containing protein [Acidimicrobiales bacterium]